MISNFIKWLIHKSYLFLLMLKTSSEYVHVSDLPGFVLKIRVHDTFCLCGNVNP